ncbi:MAG TPA: hypothetical protein PK246_04495 [Saprospiraceae bacterium]|nr:hypothetical protein [Lewinellaceae bacterium]HPK09573.1 hypothetical protein [Saprospiraceae bacterium]
MNSARSICVLSIFCVFGLNAQSDYELALRNLLPNYTIDTLDRYIQGFWKFDNLISKEGNQIDSLLHDFSEETGILHNTLYLGVKMSDYCFGAKREVVDYFDGEKCGFGVWEFNDKKQELNVCNYHDKYSRDFSRIQLYVQKLNDSIMVLIELLPDYSNMENLNYGRAIYNKVSNVCSTTDISDH